MNDPKILYAIVFKDENGKEWVDGTNSDGDVMKLHLMPKEMDYALSVYTDVYHMKTTAETMAYNRAKNFRIITVEEIIEPVVVGYREIDDD